MVVKVAFPVSVLGLYDYMVPKEFFEKITPGAPVKVELRNRSLWGVIVSISDRSKFPNLKPILEMRSGRWSQSAAAQIKLYQWIADYYLTDMGKVLKPLIKKSVADMAAKKVTIYSVNKKSVEDLTPTQKAALAKICEIKNDVLSTAILTENKISAHMLKILTQKGVLKKRFKEVLRNPEMMKTQFLQKEIVLNDEQQNAVEEIWNSYDKPKTPFLIHGITGSGKTHVYIELAKRVLQKGRGVIYLVPEIALTPQTIRRLSDALEEKVAVIHSRMSNGERRDSVEQIVSGKRRVVIGVRSVVLVPMEDVGIIIVDEEHDGSYKQSDPDPRYNARDIAVVRAAMQKALVVLGSATPSFESYYNCQTEKYKLITLKKRFGNAVLPEVKVIDMNLEHREKNWSIFSRYLKTSMEDTLTNKKQIILLLNRRGFSVSLVCCDCGYSYKCKSCSVNLIYHSKEQVVKCHQCGYFEPVPAACPECGGEQIKYSGTGIQKVEEYLSTIFPKAKTIRMDQDSTRLKGAHNDIIDRFSRREADILLGTQMVAKGLDFPEVTLVGVLQADTGLHFPDFRASERTFQLLTQVAGRAGRGDSAGEVVVQTYSPTERGIIYSRTHDYENFYRSEIEERKRLSYPPFCRIARIIVLGKDEVTVSNLISNIAVLLSQNINKSDVILLGPSPAVIERVRDEFRYTLLLKSFSPQLLNNLLRKVKDKFLKKTNGCRFKIDIDPVNML